MSILFSPCIVQKITGYYTLFRGVNFQRHFHVLGGHFCTPINIAWQTTQRAACRLAQHRAAGISRAD
jgi:hypothetical protein